MGPASFLFASFMGTAPQKRKLNPQSYTYDKKKQQSKQYNCRIEENGIQHIPYRPFYALSNCVTVSIHGSFPFPSPEGFRLLFPHAPP